MPASRRLVACVLLYLPPLSCRLAPQQQSLTQQTAAAAAAEAVAEAADVHGCYFEVLGIAAACRYQHKYDITPDYHLPSQIAQSLEQCQDMCKQDSGCRGVQFKNSTTTSKCELWSVTPQATVPSKGHYCYIKQCACWESPLRWADRLGQNCQFYSQGGHCGSLWNPKYMPEDVFPYGPYADVSCCECGGGMRSLVGNANIDPPVLSFTNITASSYYSNATTFGKNYMEVVKLNNKGWPWCASEEDKEPYVQFSFGAVHQIHSVITMGSNLQTEWRDPVYVESYQLRYQDACGKWKLYRDGEYLQGNIDYNLPKTNEVILSTRVLQILPKSWNKFACMRVELLGSSIPEPPCGTKAN